VWRAFFSAWPITHHPPRGTTIVALGDSLTEGVGAPPGQGYVDVLARMTGRPILNRGVGGDTTEDALRRLGRDVLDADPGIVIVLLGGNDLLQQRPAAEIVGNLEKIIASLHERGAMVVLVGVQSPLFGGGLGRQLRALARRTGCVFVPNILKGIIGNRRLMADQIHPNAEGHRLMAERVFEALKPYL
jgi:lysophospholipase L1-like esterase